MVQYSQDYDEVMIPVAMNYNAVARGEGRASEDSSATTPKWMDLCQPYVKSSQVFTCPSDASPGKVYTPRAGGRSTWGGYAINYCYPSSTPNRMPTSLATTANDADYYYARQVKMSAIEASATTVWVADNGNDTTTPYLSHYMEISSDTVPTIDAQGTSVTFYGDPVAYNTLRARHLETVNVLYCDGHVKAQKLTSLMAKNTAGVFKNFTIQDD